MDDKIKIAVEIASHPDKRNDDTIKFYKEGDNCVIEICDQGENTSQVVQVTIAQLRAMMNVIDAQKSQSFQNITTRPDKWPNMPVVPYTPPIINYRDGTMPYSISLQTKPS